MIHYININKKKLCGRNNQQSVLPLIIDYSTVEDVSFQFITDNNQIVDISGLSGLYFAGSLQMAQPSYDLLFLSKDYTIENNVLTFICDTYTRNYLDKIRKKQTLINIEIGQISLDVKKVMMRETALANPRVYVEGLSPQEIESHEYWTIEETQQAIDEATSGLIDKEYVDTHDTLLQEQITALDEGKQDLITDEAKIDYALISGTPTIPTKTSQLENDSGFIDSAELANYQEKLTAENKLDYALISGNPVIPQKTSDLLNDSGFATSGYVDAQLSGKADESALTAHTSNTSIHTTSEEKEAWNGKQDNIDSSHKLDYGLISGAPTIPTKTSQLQNDSGFIDSTGLADYQEKITSSAKLDYALISGNPTIPLSTSQLTNDSGFITDAALSTKQDIINSSNKLDYSLISSAPTIPTKTSDLLNDSGFATSGYVDSKLSGKQDLITAQNKLDYSLLSGTSPDNPTNVTLEMKTNITDDVFVGSFNGKQIQKWVYTDASAGAFAIGCEEFTSTATDIAPTVEYHIPISGNVSTITLPNRLHVVDVPDSLTYSGQTANDINYHVFVLRVEKDMNGTWQYYINYAYDYIETIA